MPGPALKLVATVALTAAQVALGMSQRFEGPRLDDLDVGLSEYGTPLKRFWGIHRNTGCPVIWAEKLREVHTETKTKGGKYDEYKYYGSWAVVVADHRVDAVSRVWLDKHLCYQAKDIGPISPLLGLGSSINDGSSERPVKLRRGRNMAIYLGTETQTADPRIEDWCEDRYGVNSCPAYRGVHYIVFKDIPLEKFGNRIPQVDVESVNVTSNSFPTESKTSTAKLAKFVYSPDCSRFIVDLPASNVTEIWDTATRTKLISGNIANDNPAIDASGRIWANGGTLGNVLYQHDGDTLAQLASYSVGEFTDHIYCFGNDVYLRPYGGLTERYIYLPGGAATVSVFTIAHDVDMYFQDLEGIVWAVEGETNAIKFWSPSGSFSVTTSTSGDAYALDNGAGSYFCRQGNVILLVNKATHAVTATASVSANQSDTLLMFRNMTPGSASIWFQATTTTAQEYSTETLAQIRSVTLTSWSGDDVDDMVYDPISHALICAPQFASNLRWRYLDRVGNAGVTLSTIVSEVAALCGVSSVDTSALNQSVDGYAVVQGSGRDILEPLLTLHDSVARPHDFTLQFLKLGSAASGSVIATSEFTAAEPRWAVTIIQDTDLPRRVTVNFADANKDHQANNVTAQRPLDAVDGRGDQSIDMSTYVGVPATIQKLVDRHFRRLWNERERITNGLTPQQLAIEPADNKTIELDGVQRTVRAERVTLADGRLQVEWRRDNPTLATLGTGEGADMDGRDDEGIFVAPPSKGFLLDSPFIRDVDQAANPILYYGAGSYGNSGWPGAVFYEQDSVGGFTQWNAVESWRRAPWGFTTGALADVPWSPWVWDRKNTVNVLLAGGSLTSCTEADIDADPTLNLAAIGNSTNGYEFFNFTTATQQADGSWTLSGFKRGRRGTEWACDDHVTGDLFVLLSGFQAQQLGLSDVGASFTFRAPTLGREPSSSPAISLTFAANCLKPYSPQHFLARRDSASGDWIFTWVRRTRIGGAFIGGSTIPLSEASESYDLVIPVNLPSPGTRTIAASSPTATWTSAQQTTDYGAPQTSLPANIAVYQKSASVGRGFASKPPIAA